MDSCKKLHPKVFFSSRILAIELDVEVHGCEFLFDIFTPFITPNCVPAYYITK